MLIDEFQDTNYAQLELAKLLTPSGNVTAVGDEDQSIYRFQGAYPEIFNDFLRSFKGAKTIHLKKNYLFEYEEMGLQKNIDFLIIAPSH